MQLNTFKQRLLARCQGLLARLLRHALYLRLSMLLACASILGVLMQVSTFFLLDYIPASQTAIQQVAERKLEWRLALSNSSLPLPSVSWQIEHQSGGLASLLSRLQQSEAEYRLQPSAALAGPLIKQHDELLNALRHDVEEKQTVLAMLQFMGLLLLLCCLLSAALLAKHLLVDRVAALVAMLPREQQAESDEFSQLESVVHEFSAQMQGFRAETEWFNRTRSELLRRLLRARGFVHGLVLSLQDGALNQSALNESALRTMLYSMESSLDLRNVGLQLMLKTGDGQGERLLYSQYAPTPLPEQVQRDLGSQRSAKFTLESGNECIVASFAGPNEHFGLLMLEAKPEQEFYESDITLAEITAQLLSLVLGAQSREEQARRLALFEERAAIARELHDSLAQSLSYMKIQIARLQTHKDLQHSDSHEITSELREGLDNAYRELRELLSTFRMHMDVRGLGFAIQAAIDEFAHRSPVAITLDNRLVNCRLTVNEEFHILHVIREALSNIIRHAGAQNVVVALAYSPGSTVVVTIDDDGIGLPEIRSEEPGHYGQSIMRDRAYTLGGDITITARRQGGTRVRLIFMPKLSQ